MSQEPQSQPWWQTLPGLLTAFAGVLTAVTGLLVALNQAGILKPAAQAPSAPASPSPSEASGTTPSAVSFPVQQPPETRSDDGDDDD